MKYFLILVSQCLCMFRSLPENYNDRMPENGSIGGGFDVIENMLVGENSGVEMNCRIFKRSEPIDYPEDIKWNKERYERIKKHSGSCRIGDESIDLNNCEEYNSIFDEEKNTIEEELNILSDDETSVSRIGKIRSDIFKDIAKSILSSIKKNRYFEFAVDSSNSAEGISIIFHIKKKTIEVVERVIKDKKIIKKRIVSVFSILHDKKFLNSAESALVKTKKLIERLLCKAKKLNLASESEAKHYTFVIDDDNEWSRNELNNLFLYPNSLELKNFCQKTMDQLNIKYDSLVIANSNYYQIIKAIQNKNKSNNLNGRVSNLDESAFKSVISHKRPENYFKYDYLKENNPKVINESKPNSNTNLEKEESVLEEPDFNVNLYFDSRNDNFNLFVVYIRNGRGKIFHLDLNKESFQDLLKYKVEDMKGNTTELPCNILSDYMISSINKNKTQNLKELRKDFEYNLLFISKHKYLRSVKKLYDEFKQGNNNFLDLFTNQISDSILQTYREQKDVVYDITLDDVFLCENIRSLHQTDFVNTKEFIQLRDLILKEESYKESSLEKESMTFYNEANLLELRSFMSEEIVNVVSKIIDADCSNIKIFSEFENKFSYSKQNKEEWELSAKFETIRTKFWEIFLHQEMLNDLQNPVLYFE